MIDAPESVIARVASSAEAEAAADDAPMFVLGMPEDDYHARPELSASQMKVALRSPKHFRAALTARRERAEFDVGHAVHARVLGVGLPVAVIPDDVLDASGGLRSKAAREFIAAARAGGEVPLKAGAAAAVEAAAESVLGHPKARSMMEAAGASEVSMFAMDPATGVPLRGRADRITGSVIWDLKTTATDLSDRGLMRAVSGYGYDLSAEVYRHLFRLIAGVDDVPPVRLVFVEKDPPYDVRVVELGEAWQVGGWLRFRRALDLVVEGESSGSWAGVDEVGPVAVLPAPEWYRSGVDSSVDEVEDLGWF